MLILEPQSYCVVGIGILLVSIRTIYFFKLCLRYMLPKACGLYYYIWIVLIPRLGGYEVIEEVEEIEGGARLARLIRKYPSTTTTRSQSHSEEREHLLSSPTHS